MVTFPGCDFPWLYFQGLIFPWLYFQALISRVVAARGEVMQKGHTVKQAVDARDAFAKVNPQSVICYVYKTMSVHV